MYTNIRAFSPELEVKFWEHGKYLNPLTAGPPSLIPISAVVAQAARITLSKYPRNLTRLEYTEEDGSYLQREGQPMKVWATIGLTRVRARV